jgi:hypothetical protein
LRCRYQLVVHFARLVVVSVFFRFLAGVHFGCLGGERQGILSQALGLGFVVVAGAIEVVKVGHYFSFAIAGVILVAVSVTVVIKAIKVVVVVISQPVVFTGISSVLQVVFTFQ